MEETIEIFIDRIKQNLNVDTVIFDMNTPFKEIEKWDSLSNMGLLAFIDQDYGIILDYDDLLKYDNPLKLYNYVYSKK